MVTQTRIALAEAYRIYCYFINSPEYQELLDAVDQDPYGCQHDLSPYQGGWGAGFHANTPPKCSKSEMTALLIKCRQLSSPFSSAPIDMFQVLKTISCADVKQLKEVIEIDLKKENNNKKPGSPVTDEKLRNPQFVALSATVANALMCHFYYAETQSHRSTPYNRASIYFRRTANLLEEARKNGIVDNYHYTRGKKRILRSFAYLDGYHRVIALAENNILTPEQTSQYVRANGIKDFVSNVLTDEGLTDKQKVDNILTAVLNPMCKFEPADFLNALNIEEGNPYKMADGKTYLEALQQALFAKAADGLREAGLQVKNEIKSCYRESSKKEKQLKSDKLHQLADTLDSVGTPRKMRNEPSTNEAVNKTSQDTKLLQSDMKGEAPPSFQEQTKIVMKQIEKLSKGDTSVFSGWSAVSSSKTGNRTADQFLGVTLALERLGGNLAETRLSNTALASYVPTLRK